MNTAEASFKFYGYEPKDDPESDVRFYYHAFLDDFIAAYLDVYVTDGAITDKVLHFEWIQEGDTITDMIGSEFKLPEGVESDVWHRIRDAKVAA